MCYYLCVLRWLMRPILALNCLLQIEQENRSEEESSVGDVLALAFRCARFCSASLILFASYSPAPLLWGFATLFDPVQTDCTDCTKVYTDDKCINQDSYPLVLGVQNMILGVKTAKSESGKTLSVDPHQTPLFANSSDISTKMVIIKSNGTPLM